MFKQKAWLKPYIMMNTDKRKETKNEFDKEFFKLMNNSVFGKTMENVRNHRDIKLVTTDKRRKDLVSRPNYHTSKCFSENLMAIEMKKTYVLLNKPVYLGQAILDISKTLKYEFYYDYLKPRYKDKVKLCYMDTDSFILLIETEDFFKDITDDVNEWFDTSNYDQNDKRLLPIRVNKKVLGKFKYELNGKIMTEFCAPWAETYAFRCDNDEEIKKPKGTKECVIKKNLIFDNFEESGLVIIRSQLRFKSDHHKMYTDEVNKIAIRSIDDKRIQTFDGITTYQYGTNAFKVCEPEMLTKIKGKPIAMYYWSSKYL